VVVVVVVVELVDVVVEGVVVEVDEVVDGDVNPLVEGPLVEEVEPGDPGKVGSVVDAGGRRSAPMVLWPENPPLIA
jgi:hypothetical protein